MLVTLGLPTRFNESKRWASGVKDCYFSSAVRVRGESSASRKKYIVQEPMDQLDFIFEPEHYKVTKESVRETSLNDAKLENKFTHARVVSENDEGFLQYEYQSYTYVNKNCSDKKADVSQDDFEFCGNDFDIMHHHLDAIVRGEIFLF